MILISLFNWWKKPTEKQKLSQLPETIQPAETGLSLGNLKKVEFDFSNPEQKEGIAESARAVFKALDEAHRNGTKISFLDLIKEGLKNAKAERTQTLKQLPDGTATNNRTTGKD